MRVFSINGDPYEQVDVTDLSDHRLARDGLSWFLVQNNCLSLGLSVCPFVSSFHFLCLSFRCFLEQVLYIRVQL